MLIVALAFGEREHYRGRQNRHDDAIEKTAQALKGNHDCLVSEAILLSDKGGRHNTRMVADAVGKMLFDKPVGKVLLVAHRLHSARALAVFRKKGFSPEIVTLDTPLDPDDLDWKLRSLAAWKFYNALAWMYCWYKGWV